MVLIVVLIIVCCAILFNYIRKNTEGTKHWCNLFWHITDTILRYYTGTPTKIVLYSLYVIGLLSGATTFGFPIIKAIVERNEANGFWKIFLECQWEEINIWMGIISIVAIVVIVGIYLFVNKSDSLRDKELKEIKDHTSEAIEISKSNSNKLDIILLKLDKYPSEDIKQLLPRFKDDIHSLKVRTAYAHLQDINALLKHYTEQDKSLLAIIQYYLGLCARFSNVAKCEQHFESAYNLMQQIDEKIPEILEGMVYVSCKAKKAENAQNYASELRIISPTNIWTIVPDLVFSANISAVYNSIPNNIDKSFALANAMLIGWKTQEDQVGIDFSKYEYIELNNITTTNFPLWIKNLTIATNKFIQSMQIRRRIQSMFTTEAQKLYELTDQYLSLLTQTEIENLLPDTVFLHAFTGYLKNTNKEWIDVMYKERNHIHLKELYYLGYAIMLKNSGQFSDATQLLKDYGDDTPSSILNMRLSIAFEIGNTTEMVDVIKDAAQNNADIPDHLLPNFIAVVANLYDEVKEYAACLLIQNPLSKGFYEQFILFEEKQEIDIAYLQNNETEFTPLVYPYLAAIYKEKLGLDRGIEVLLKCIDSHILDLRTYRLIDYYKQDSKYTRDLYHLLRELRNAGEIDDNLLWLELEMADKIQDYVIGLEISSQLIERHSDDFSTIVFHIKMLRGLERSEEIKSYEEKINTFNLQNVPSFLISLLVNIYISIHEIKFAIDLLYQGIKISNSQELKDIYYSLSLHSSIYAFIGQKKDKVEAGDYIEIKKEDAIEKIEITLGSVYSDMIGKCVNETVKIYRSQPEKVTIISIHSKYYKLLEDVNNDIMNQKSRSIKVFSLNDYNFEEDPIGAIHQMLGDNPNQREIHKTNVLNYKNGELSLYAFVHNYDEIASLYNIIYDDHFNVYTLPNEYLKELFTEEDKFHDLECVLDLSSLILLQQVDVQYGLIYNSKFLIPISLQYLLKEAKIKEETSTSSLLYQSVMDTVIIKYEDETKTPLWNLINNLLSWIETRCEIKIVEDKLNISNKTQNTFFSIESDSVFLATQGRLLITEDRVWIGKMCKVFPSMSTSNWLHLYKFDFASKFAQQMLSCGNFGVPMTSQYIVEQYKALINHQKNTYSFCKTNIEINPFVYTDVLNAGKSILEGDNTPKTISDMTNLFVFLLQSMSLKTALMVCYKETRIPQSSVYLECLQNALRIAHQIK